MIAELVTHGPMAHLALRSGQSVPATPHSNDGERG